tara:strand:+ start:64 stop:399 length:336 start_codon:yes stop_codon:yes gene_type:complete
MKLIANDYHFYPDGDTRAVSKYDSALGVHYVDVEECNTSIRIYGTEEQVEQTKNDYIERTGLCLDEVYDFEEYRKDAYNYNEKMNDLIRNKLNNYKDLYEKNNYKPLIIRI